MTRTSMKGFPIIFLFSCLSSIFIISYSIDTITITQFITDNETIVSTNGSFEMGFFTPGSSKNRYVGIWYKKISIQTVVWVANRESPLTDASGVLKLIMPGILILINGNNTIIWSSNASISARQPVAQLMDSGNLVVRDAEDHNPENFIWESFDYPCDTLLPGMKIGRNFLTGHEQHLSSWKSSDDPARGDYTFHAHPSEVFLMKGSNELFRSGPWNGIRFNGWSGLKLNSIYTFELVFNHKEVYYSYQLLNRSTISRLVVNQSGYGQRWIWVDETQDWSLYLFVPTNICDDYGVCGVYGSCNIENSPRCACLSKFVPKDPKQWEKAYWFSGCVRRTPLDCYGGDGFVKYSNLKFPDTRFSWFNESMGLEECKSVCLRNCTCMAYANSDIRNGGSGCLLWFGELLDFRDLSESEQDIYIRMASSELDSAVKQVDSKGKKKTIIIVSLILSIGMVLLSLTLALYIWKKKKKKKNIQMQKEAGRLAQNFEHSYTNESHKEDYELPSFDLATIVNATDNFCINNKLGEGGFGPVYKGMLEEGQEIAVKRLSKSSNQGVDEFKNEVIYIAKLQHRNLVKLLGCCIEGEEKMLIYEYMPNKSLDFYIFDEFHRKVLDWPKRFNIINGIARGLLYLHQDSRLRIIHRDLKPSNILLDNELSPKISDFGMARCFGGNEIEAITSRVVGTYGYMSPEYAIDGHFSIKSDVFSFGVLVLEIVSGKRNRGFFHPDHNHNLLGHAWILYKEGRQMEFIDALIQESCYIREMLRSIHVGLLCVQQCGEDRPNMSSVVLMLGSDGELHQPKQPGFFTERNILDWSSGKQAPSSDYEAYITECEPR